ncbi:MAG TPA: hypothetical protein VMW20_04580 [Candidatus Nanoarchaeia archaeon]|nr:hypothetical protein [Candidatus Nanoarchaeia archaeon]
MVEELEVTLIKKLEYKRIDCTCGVAVMPKDPTPELSEAIKGITRKFDAKFRILDINVHPDVVLKYHIKTLPCVLIDGKTYQADAEVVNKVLAEIVG